MNRIDVALYLINEAKEKEELLKKYKEDLSESNINWDDFNDKYPQTPSKQIILEDLKIARRLLNEEVKEIKEND